ncbi:MAG: hypothetical protein V1811_03195 [Candidatus Micrarchaeota archaeon]
MKKKPVSNNLLIAAAVVLVIVVVAFLFFNGPKTTAANVLIIGSPSQTLLDTLASEDFKIAGVTVTKVVSDSQVTAKDLDGANLVIMQGEEYCDNTLRLYLNKAGPNLLIVGNACSRSQYRSSIGFNALLWEQEFAGHVDRALELSDAPLASNDLSGKFVIDSAYHQLFSGILNYGFSGEVTVFKPHRSFVIASICDENDSNYDLSCEGVPAIVEMQTAPSALYFAFDPSTTSRNLFFNAMKYASQARQFGT